MASRPQVEVHVVDDGAAADVHAVVRAAFGARPALDPPADALAETVDSIAAELARDGGLLATVDGRPVGALLFEPAGLALALRRFGVAPDAQGLGVAGALVRAAEEHAADRHFRGLRVLARVELPESIAFWEHNGFVRAGGEGVLLHLAKVFERRVAVPTAEDAQRLGRALGEELRAGDLVILTGDLGAGKTTFTQGVGAALDVQGAITSPTFVIAREHPPAGRGPGLVHVDAYRLGGVEELDDLDLDTSLADAVTVVEWGEGLAEALADERLELAILRRVGEDGSAGEDDGALEDHDPREVVVRPVGLRWLELRWPDDRLPEPGGAG